MYVNSAIISFLTDNPNKRVNESPKNTRNSRLNQIRMIICVKWIKKSYFIFSWCIQKLPHSHGFQRSYFRLNGEILMTKWWEKHR